MINSIIRKFILFLVFTSALQGGQFSCFSEGLVEVKMGYIFFANSKMRKIYDRGGFDIQLAASYPLCNISRKWTLNAYGALEYFHFMGKSSDHQSTSLWATPVNIGIKSVYSASCNTEYYFSIGPRYFSLHQHNHSSYVYRNQSRKTLGLFVNTGFHYFLCNRLVLDLFGEYSYAKIHFRGQSRVYTRNIQVGGFTFGGGLGYSF